MIRTLFRRLNEYAILAAFFMIPLWYRFPESLVGSHLYVTRFAILLPMLIAIFAWLLRGMPGLRDLRKSRWGVLWATALLALSLWAFFSQTWAYMRVRAPDVGATTSLQLGIVALFAIVTACIAPSPRLIVRILLIALIANAALTIGQAIVQNDVGLRSLGEFTFSPDKPGVSVIVSGDLRWVRPYGLLPHPNILAGSLVIGLFAAGAGVLGEKGRWRALAMVGVWLGFGALLLTFSRAAWLAFAGGGVIFLLLVYPLLRDKTRLRVSLIAIAGIIAVGLIFVAVYRPLISARTGVGEESIEMRSISDRIVFTEFALRAIRERPVFGFGIGNFPWRTTVYIRQTFYDLRGDHVHQIYLYAAAELGLVGLGLFVSAIILGLIGGVAALRRSSNDERAARAAMIAGAVAFAIVGLLDHYPYTILHMQMAWWGCIAVAMAADRKP